MGFEKAIESGKEHRKEYRKAAQQVDHSTRNHGGDKWYESDRTIQSKKLELDTKDKQEDI